MTKMYVTQHTHGSMWESQDPMEQELTRREESDLQDITADYLERHNQQDGHETGGES